MTPSQRGATSAKKIWVDLDNSPHVPLFEPILEALRAQGYAIVLTGRDCFQVKELVDLFGLRCRLVGRHYGRNRFLKLIGTLCRSLQLLGAVWRDRPVLSVSHGSRAQLLASVLLRIPSVGMSDYEFARGLGFIRPTWVMVPDVIASLAFPFQTDHVLRYPGTKEDVYVPRFKPDARIRAELELDEKAVVVTVRPPAEEAHYHNRESEVLFAAVMELLTKETEAKVVILPRTETQAAGICRRWPTALASRRITIPAKVVHGLNLIWFSDLVISGGGTMNREAAALGVPVYSIFRGKMGAVDHYLARQGRLILVQSVEDVRKKIVVRRRARPDSPAKASGRVLASIVEQLVRILERY